MFVVVLVEFVSVCYGYVGLCVVSCIYWCKVVV